MVCTHTIGLGAWSYGLFTHGNIGHFAIYMIGRYLHCIEY